MPTARAQTVFLAAAEITDPAARAQYLAEACGGDLALKARVEALLRAHDQPDSLLDAPLVSPPHPDHAATRAFAPDPDHAATRTIGHEGSAAADDEVPLGFLAPATRPDSLGRIGHYEVLQVLGQGGFGIVFRAFDDVLQRVVAVKMMAPQLAATSPARKRFLREARTSAAVRHENVVQVYEVGEAPLPYIAMEFIPGETLQQRLDRIGPIEPAEVVRVGRQIAEGLAAAHATDLIHRDIKPANVLLEGLHQKVKITDFGLARAADDASISQSGIIAGTPMYMAPEQAKGDKLDQRADLFSLGSVLYQMASGRSPFRANSTVAVLKRVAEDTPRDIREIILETPQWLCDIIAKLHAKNPDERFQTAREVADVLADCEAQLKANAKLKDYSRIPRGKPAAKSSGRWKWVTAAVLLLPVMALAVTELTGVTHLVRKPQQETADPVKPGGEPTPVLPAKPEPLPPTFKNGIGMEFVIVPKGKSWLGGGKDKSGDKEVVIPADFYLGKYEVTQDEWTQVMGETPSHFSRTGGGKDAVQDIPDADLKRFPVESVSWDQCQVFVAKLNEREKESGWVYRLPTEVEWEYACRGGPMADRADSAFDFYFAQPTKNLLPGQANFSWRLNRTCKVGSYEPNRLGLFDMHGNVIEWLDDAAPSSRRLSHGGSYTDDPSVCRAAAAVTHPSVGSGNGLGVRLARIPSGAPSPEVKTPPTLAPFTDADVLRIAALPAAEQVEEVRKELMRRNPDFHGKLIPTIKDGVVTGLTIQDVKSFTLADLSPLRGMKLTELILTCHSTATDLTPLGGMPLEHLSLWPFQGSDLTPLKGMPLKVLNCGGGGQKLDLTPLAGLPLEYLCINFSQISDLTPLKGMPLKTLECSNTLVADLAPLKGMPLHYLQLFNTKVSDLAPIQGLLLHRLDFYGTPVNDLSPLKGMELEDIRLTPKNITKGLDILRNMKSLKIIGIDYSRSWPAEEFWGRYDKGEFDGTFSDADVQRISALPAPQQVEEVRQELMRRNPGFAGNVENKIEDGVVVEFKIVNAQVTDIAPIRVFNALRVLDLSACNPGGQVIGQLADLTPLKGVNLSHMTRLALNNTKIDDAGLIPFKDCKNLTHLWLGHTQVSNAGLGQFKDCKNLTALNLKYTRVDDAGLVHFKDCKALIGLDLSGLPVTNQGLANFKDCKDLTSLWLPGTQVTDAGLAYFKDCKNLIILHVAGTQVTDAGLVHLKGCKKLSRVWLDSTQITDTGLAHLAGLDNLTELQLAKTKVTAKGVEGLTKALPKCMIQWDGGLIEPK